MLVALITLLASSYLAMQNTWVQTKITQQVAIKLSKRLNTNITVGKVEIGFFNKLYLEDVLIEDQNNDTLLYSQLIKATIDTFKLRKRRISIDELSFVNNTIHISRDSSSTYNFGFILNAIGNDEKTDTLNYWNLNCNRFDFDDIDIKYSDVLSNKHSNIYAHDLNLDISDFYSTYDSISFNINHLSAHDGKLLSLEDASAQVVVHTGEIDIDEFNLKSKHSTVKSTKLNLQVYQAADSMNVPFDIRLNIGESSLSFRELGELVPALKGMNQKVEMSGLIYGNLSDLKGKNLVLKTGTNTNAILDFYINDVTSHENMYLFLDLKQSESSFDDISNFRFPNKSKYKYIEFPENFYEAGLLKFHGNFSGFLTDFVTFGTLESEMGTLTTDILVMPEKEGEIYYRGNISTNDFKLGELFNNTSIGEVTFSGSADGNYNKTENSVSGIFKGNVKNIEVNKYNYSNIKFNGILIEKMFDGLLSINDSNLKFVFLGELDLNNEIPRFDFSLNVSKAQLAKLNLGSTFPKAEVAFKMMANFEGNRIDNLDGKIIFEEGYYKNRNGELSLSGMELTTLNQNESHSLLFTSDFFDASVNGMYNFHTIKNCLQKIIHHFVPSSNFSAPAYSNPNIFDFRINVKELTELAQIFVPGLEFETPFLLYGKIDSPNNDVHFSGSIPSIKYNDIWARNIFIGNQNTNNLYSSKFRVSEILHRNGMKIYNFTINSKVADNKLNNIISWSNSDELTYSGVFKTETVFSRPDSVKHQHIEIRGLPSKIYVADTLWTIAPFLATIDSSSFEFTKFSISHGEQLLEANGKITEGKTDRLNLQLENIDLSYFDKYLNRKFELEGLASGALSVVNAFNEPVILSNLSVDKLHYKKQSIGDISLISRWNRIHSTIDSELKIVRDEHNSLKTFGYFKPSTKELNYYAEVDSLPLIILEVFMRKNFSDFNGYGTGKVQIGGNINKLDLNGAVFVENAGLKVNTTQILYSLSDSIYFINDTINFDNITFYDDKDNPGKFDGIITHENFQNMAFDLNFSSEKIRAMNTTARDNEQFYGTILANGNLNITGKSKSTELIGSVTTLLGTDVRISMESENTVEQYDFIEFVKAEETEENIFFAEEIEVKKGELDMTFTIEATPDAKVQIIYNSQIGDVIKAQGEGILLFEMDNNGNMSLSGNYNPTKGDYLFTLQSVINKRFSIEQGGSIVWSGDPYNAIIDLNAIYKLKASLYDILPDYFDYESQKQRIPVECIIKLDDELVNPTIGFDINLPGVDESIKDRISQFIKTEEEINKQILSLIIMGKFYTPEYKRGIYEAQNSNMVGTTASELMSNQLSNWLSQINSNWDVGLNYRPGSEVTDDEIEVALSTQIFNDRVSLDGNIGNNPNNYSNNSSSSQIVGDFEIGVKLVPSGKIQFKAYNRSNNNLIYETAPYTQGIGLSFKEEYNTFDELLKKMGAIFKKKKK